MSHLGKSIVSAMWQNSKWDRKQQNDSMTHNRMVARKWDQKSRLVRLAEVQLVEHREHENNTLHARDGRDEWWRLERNEMRLASFRRVRLK